jgi:two-component system, NtrC family, sensor histidine kinase PilS
MTQSRLFWFESEETTLGAWESEPSHGSFGRLWRVFMVARVAIATVLVILQAFIYAMGSTQRWSIAVCISYLIATLAVRFFVKPKPPASTFDGQWVFTVGVDVLAFSLLNHLQSGSINYTPLFALPVLLSSVLGPILLALGTAASVTLFLLGDAWWSAVQGGADFGARLLQAGLSGSGFFLVAVLANQLALRLAREEQLVKASQSAARMQGQVNELVIETLADGVLVVDINGIVRSANPASRRLLAADSPLGAPHFMLAAEPAWLPLAELTHLSFASQAPQQASITLEHPGYNTSRLHARTRLAAAPSGSRESLCVIFLEDLREMGARVRTEKLAAMGRMSAAVAHEIRNPLAAISQANALLEEDLQDPSQRQLTTMISQNAQRLAKIVDEVLNISRAQTPAPALENSTVLLDEAIRRIAADWASQAGALERTGVSTLAAHISVWFEPEHLRRLMINLLDNALRYAGISPNSIQISTTQLSQGQARLSVWSDGQPLEKTVQNHLFEPFFSSESRSSGLGLYICRELCERYGALIGYQRATIGGVPGNEFFVVFRPRAVLGAAPASVDKMSA